jgi:hypothetical protein
VSSKWEREIEELLRDKFEDKPRRLPGRDGRPPGRRPQRDWWRWLRNFSPERLMVYGLVVIVASWFLRFFAGGLSFWFGIVGVVLIVLSLLFSVLNRENPRVQKRWRGQVVQLPRRRSWLEYQWLRLQNTLSRWLGRR